MIISKEKIELLKSLSFEVDEKEANIQVIFNERSQEIIEEIKKIESQFDYESFIDMYVNKALEETFKDMKDENK